MDQVQISLGDERADLLELVKLHLDLINPMRISAYVWKRCCSRLRTDSGTPARS